jgi:hypothetical protein
MAPKTKSAPTVEETKLITYAVGLEKVDGENYRPVALEVGTSTKRIDLFPGSLPKDIAMQYVKRYLLGMLERI